MTTRLRRYEFSERLADLLGESRRDLRVRVTMMVSGGLLAPGPRGPGAPPAAPDYAADLLIGVMAAPAQLHTVEAIRCYRELAPTAAGTDPGSPGVTIGPPARRRRGEIEAADVPFLADRPRFGEALARLLTLTHGALRDALGRELFGVWLSRGFPVAAVQLAAWADGRSGLITQRYELPTGVRPPAWLDPEAGAAAHPGLFHSVFLPAGRLIEIGLLTTPSPARPSPAHERTAMIDLGQTISHLASLARDRRNRRPWEKFLSTAAPAQDRAEQIDASGGRLVEVPEFGSNPGNLRMLTFVPDDLPPQPALVVVLHGCTQTATSYDYGTGWSTLAERHGFALLLPEQRRSNNPLRCFNWFRAEDNARDGGEALSIRQMVDRMIAAHGIDPKRVYVTGLSAGAAMTSVMLATYPEAFAGGAILAGVPYRCASGLQDAFEVIFQGRSRPAGEWGDLVRAASAHTGPWPRVAVWHGAADSTVKPLNAEEILNQWADVHGLPPAPTLDETTPDGHRHRIWRDGQGRDAIESYTIAGMGHGAPIDTRGPDGCGNAAPFIPDIGISSTHTIATSWGLTATRRATKPRPEARPQARPQAGASGPAPSSGTTRPVRTIEPEIIEIRRGKPRPAPDATPAGRIINVDTDGKTQSDDSAGTGTSSGAGTGNRRSGSATPPPSGLDIGVDIPKILAMSFEAAGLMKGSGRTSRSEPGRGIDVTAIVAQALEAAGLLRSNEPGAPETPRSGSQGTDSPGGQTAGTRGGPAVDTRGGPAVDTQGGPAAGKPASPPDEPAAAAEPAAAPALDTVATATESGLAGTGWEGDWQLVAAEAGNAGEPATLFGCASSGTGGVLGRQVRTLAREMTLGDRPMLNYVRKVDLQAQANILTSASFRVLVDGICVDEVATIGMDFAEADWTERKDIDLTRFAGRTVTLTFEVTASANTAVEVLAKAWLRGATVRNAAMAA